MTALAVDGAHVPNYAGTITLSSTDLGAIFADAATGVALPGNSYTFNIHLPGHAHVPRDAHSKRGIKR